MFSGQIRRSCCETCSAIDVHRFREILMLRTLDHYLLANVTKRVCNCARRYVATKDMTHVFPGRSISCYVSKVPESNTHLRIDRLRIFLLILLCISFYAIIRCIISYLSLLDPSKKEQTFMKTM